MERNYSVYKHTTPSGKVYIGLTGMSPKERWDSGHGYKNNPHFWNAIQLYGWNNIAHEVLKTNLTRDEACELEKELISKYDSRNQEKGYNVLEGGTYGFRFTHTEEARQKISESSKHLWESEEHRKRMSEIRSGENNPFYGQHHTEETRQKMKDWYKEHPLSDEERAERGKRLSWKGKTRSKESVEKSSKAKWKPVAQYDLNENLIRVWSSAKEACETLHIQKSSLSQCCNGKRNKAGGYIWRYADTQETG